HSLLLFFNHTAPPELYTLSLHDALPISLDATTARLLPDGRLAVSVSDEPGPPAMKRVTVEVRWDGRGGVAESPARLTAWLGRRRSEEHTSELQSRRDLVCRLLLEKKKTE